MITITTTTFIIYTGLVVAATLFINFAVNVYTQAYKERKRVRAAELAKLARQAEIAAAEREEREGKIKDLKKIMSAEYDKVRQLESRKRSRSRLIFEVQLDLEAGANEKQCMQRLEKYNKDITVADKYIDTARQEIELIQSEISQLAGA